MSNEDDFLARAERICDDFPNLLSGVDKVDSCLFDLLLMADPENTPAWNSMLSQLAAAAEETGMDFTVNFAENLVPEELASVLDPHGFRYTGDWFFVRQAGTAAIPAPGP